LAEVKRSGAVAVVKQHLKKVRIAVSVVWFLLTALVFVDIKDLVPASWTSALLWPQFLPSLLKFSHVLAFAGFGFAFVIVLTLLFGRVYCSSICPLGTMQDFFSYIARKMNRRFRQPVMPRYDALRFSILTLTVVAVVAGIPVLAVLLDPFSSAGRILSTLVRPLLIGGNNAISSLLEKFGIYSLYPADVVVPGIVAISAALITLGAIGYLSYTRGRLYCNSICPVGAILGLISRVALFKVSIDEGDCKGCGLCDRVCKGGCIDRKAKTVDFDRCVACFNCFDVCPREGMEFRTLWKRNLDTVGSVDQGRRRFVKQGTGAFALVAFALEETKKIIKPTKPTTIRVGSALPSSPPGSVGVARFTSICTACHVCVDACPPHVLQPSFTEYGVAGILQPRMDYGTAYCNFDCTVCGEVCPTGAILPLGKDDKKLTQVGIAKFEKRNCIVNTEHTDCGACSEHCPTKAVTMVPFEGKLVIPEVREEFCIGCGACEHACPTRPWRAIYVESNAVHKRSKKPPEQKLVPAPAIKEDFPF
jgi:ferredoxin